MNRKEILIKEDLMALLTNILAVLKPRQQEVIIKRYGLDGAKPQTLAQIGESFSITRERVRQIEEASLERIKKDAKEIFGPVSQILLAVIQDKGGVVSDKDLMEFLFSEIEQTKRDLYAQITRFLLVLEEKLSKIKENDLFREGWRLSSIEEDLLKEIVQALINILEEEKKILTPKELIEKLLKKDNFKSHPQKPRLTQKLLRGCVDIASPIKKTPEGKVGLISWPLVNPKTIRDKAYFVLSRIKKPMHFREIAEAIKNHNFDKKSVTVQTVHNELIADPRFVLIGRGIYGLSEWGLEKGTVPEVIEKILKEANRPLSKEEIIQEVLKTRQVKRTTILVNLQANPKFKRTPEGYYILEY